MGPRKVLKDSSRSLGLAELHLMENGPGDPEFGSGPGRLPVAAGRASQNPEVREKLGLPQGRALPVGGSAWQAHCPPPCTLDAQRGRNSFARRARIGIQDYSQGLGGILPLSTASDAGPLAAP